MYVTFLQWQVWFRAGLTVAFWLNLYLDFFWDQIFKGQVTMVQVRYWLEICWHGYAVKTLFNEAYAKFESSLLSYFSK